MLRGGTAPAQRHPHWDGCHEGVAPEPPREPLPGAGLVGEAGEGAGCHAVPQVELLAPKSPAGGGRGGDGRRWHSLAHAWGQRESLGDNPRALGTSQKPWGWPRVHGDGTQPSPAGGFVIPREQKSCRREAERCWGGGRGVHGGLGTGPPPATRAAVTPSQPQRVQGLGTGDGFGALHPPRDALPLGDSATAGGDSPGGGRYLQLPASDRPRSWRCCSCSLRESAAVSGGGLWGHMGTTPLLPIRAAPQILHTVGTQQAQLLRQHLHG